MGDEPMQEVIPVSVGSQPFALVAGYETVRMVARDWHHYTSATPFRVPIPEESALRSIRQYPIETDPPDHGRYRSIIEPRFARSSARRIQPTVHRLTESILAAGRETGSLDVVSDLALPVVTTAIATTIGRPDDAARFLSWGVHVFVDPVTGERRRNTDVEDYLATRVDQALSAGPSNASSNDLFDDLANADFDGRPLTRDELLGYGSLVLAGGRDTVISAIVGMAWHLGTHPEVREGLGQQPELIQPAVEEYLRYFSPLPLIGRTATEDHDLSGHRVAAGDLLGLGFAAANHDYRAFEQPGVLRTDRRPNRHVAFGHGPHTCIGAPLARMQLSVIARCLTSPDIETMSASVPWTDRPNRANTSTDWMPHDLMLRLVGKGK